MDFGLYANFQAPAGTPVESLAEDMLAQTRAARDGGFDLLITGQHYLSDYEQLQIVPTLGRLAAEAGSMALGTGVLLLPLHHPVEVAEQMATLDAFADGVVVGVGSGYRDVEFDAFGIDKRERIGRMVEGIEIMNRLWTETDVTYEGEYYSLEGATITPRPEEKPTVWIGANHPRAVERAARIGDAWFANPQETVEELRERKVKYDAIRRERGRETGIPLFREAFVADSKEEALDVAGEHLAGKYQRYLDWGQGETVPDEFGGPLEQLAEECFLLGPPEEICAEIERYREVGVDRVVVRSMWPGLPREEAVRSIERLGDEVLPNV